MGLRDDMMAADIANLAGNTTDGGQIVRVKPNGRGLHAFNWDAIPGPWEDGLEEAMGGYGIREGRVAFTGPLATWTTAVDRKPRSGDRIVVETGEHAGTWRVETAPTNGAGAVTCNCVDPKIIETGQRGEG